MADDAKPSIPGPKPGEASPATKSVKVVEPPRERVDAHMKNGFPPDIAKALAQGEEPAPLSDVVERPEPDSVSAQKQRSVDPAEPHGFVEEDFKRDAAGAHPVDASPAEIVSSTEAEHTLAKGLSEDGESANGLTLGDRISG